MLVRPQGPVERRPGTKFIAAVKDANDEARLIPFEYSTSDAYVLEFGDLYFRIYRNGGQVVDANSVAVEVVTPWDSNDIFELQFVQDAEVMRVVHPDYRPYKITRTSHIAWTCTAITFANGPFRDDNTDTASTITPSATTGTINLAATGTNVFDPNHVGALWQLTQRVDGNSVTGTFTTTTYYPSQGGAADQNSTELFVWKGQDYTMACGGYWMGTLLIQRSYDDKVTWENVYAYTKGVQTEPGLVYTGTEDDEDAYYRMQMKDMIGYRPHRDEYYLTANYSLMSLPFSHEGVVTIATVVDGNDATATVVGTLPNTRATYTWAEGYWSNYRGWPRTVEHYEQRCVYGGSASFPQTVWASITASQDSDYDDFDDGNKDEDDAWLFILPGMNPIQWLRAQEYLMVGTTAGIGRMGSADEGITPTNIEYRMQAHTGSDYIQAVYAVDGILYVERGGQKIREVMFTSTSERYVADDMTVLAEHITGTGVTQIALQNRPDPILWCVRDDGQLLSFTYHRRHDVTAWARQTEAGTFESVAVIPATDEDVVYAVVNRTIDSNSTRYVENFAPLDWGTDQNDCWFVDSGVTDGNSLSHLEGEEVTIFADGRPIGQETVSSGAITASGYTNYVIGLPYTSIYESMPLVAQGQGLTSALMKTAVLTVNYDFQDTLACNHGWDASKTSAIQFSDDSFATTVDAFTGIKTVTFPRGISRDMTIYIDVNDPVPMKIRGINPQLQVVTN
jgi:hypothetical protein